MLRSGRTALAVLLILITLPCTGAADELSEVARWLRAYIQVDTTNPPGGERPAAEYLADLLHGAGIATQLLVTAGDRASLYARLPATAPRRGGALLLLHHIDVVPAGPGWSRDPFAGEVSEGRLWGRGAIDAKSLGIIHLAALIHQARSEVPRHRDVIFLAVADEESGGRHGTAWLLERHPELFGGVAGVINEGGANLVTGGKVRWWGVEVAQKRPLWLEVEVTGRGGHGSGFHPASAVHTLVGALDDLLERPPRWHVSPPVRDYLAAIAPFHNDKLADRFRRIEEVVSADGFAEPLPPGMANLFLDSVQVTVLEGGERINVVPARARARIDVRMLPDTDAEAFLERIREALGDEIEVEVLLRSPPAPPSSTDTRLYELLEEVLGEEGPVVPAFIGGFTDSRYFRQRGIPAYGLAPFALSGLELRGIHGPDEAIPLDELERGVERMDQLVSEWVAAAQDP